MNLTRKQAILALVSALPGAAMAANRPIDFGTAEVLKYEPPRYAVIFRPNGIWEIPLGDWPCLRITLGGESVEFTGAELFAALRAEEHVHGWHSGPFFVTAAYTFEEPTYYPPNASVPIETCACGAMRLSGGIGKFSGQNIATSPERTSK